MLLTRRERLSLVGGAYLLERANWLDRIADELRKGVRTSHLLKAGILASLTLARNVDANRSIANFRFFAEMIKNHRDETFEMSDAMNYVSSKPCGRGRTDNAMEPPSVSVVLEGRTCYWNGEYRGLQTK